MKLALEIEKTANQALASLEMAQDYYFHNIWLWRFLQLSVTKGRARFTLRNRETGKKVDEKQLAQRAQFYITDYHSSWTFQHTTAIFEAFFFAALQSYLRTYPGRLAKKQVEFGEILNVDKAEIIQTVAGKEANELAYKRVTEWFKYLEGLGIDSPSENDIGRLAEIKAARDVLVHNNGKINEIYISKAGKFALRKLDEQLAIAEPYLLDSVRLLKKLIKEVSSAMIKKST